MISGLVHAEQWDNRGAVACHERPLGGVCLVPTREFDLKNGTYEQSYITLMRFKDGKLCLFREYWDTTEVTRACGNLGESF